MNEKRKNKKKQKSEFALTSKMSVLLLALLSPLALRGGTHQPPTCPAGEGGWISHADEGGWRGEVLEEMEALRSIFGEDAQISVSSSTALACRIRIDGERGGAPVFLQVNCGHDYPDTVPETEVTVEGNSAVARLLAEELAKEAQEQRGQLMIFHLAR